MPNLKAKPRESQQRQAPYVFNPVLMAWVAGVRSAFATRSAAEREDWCAEPRGLSAREVPGAPGLPSGLPSGDDLAMRHTETEVFEMLHIGSEVCTSSIYRVRLARA